VPAADVVGWMMAAGGGAARLLATAGGLTYYEARKPR
jgi:hypothetical protein